MQECWTNLSLICKVKPDQEVSFWRFPPLYNMNDVHFERFTVPPNGLTATLLDVSSYNPKDFHVISQSRSSHRKRYVYLPPWLALATITKSAGNKILRIIALTCLFIYLFIYSILMKSHWLHRKVPELFTLTFLLTYILDNVPGIKI